MVPLKAFPPLQIVNEPELVKSVLAVLHELQLAAITQTLDDVASRFVIVKTTKIQVFDAKK